MALEDMLVADHLLEGAFPCKFCERVTTEIMSKCTNPDDKKDYCSDVCVEARIALGDNDDSDC